MIKLPKNQKVAYLGPIGTFSYFTALNSLDEAELVPFHSFKAIFEAVQNNICPIALVPLENSIHGTIGQNFDLFIQYDSIRIQGEVIARISNALLTKEENPQNIDRIYSHAQPLGQCSEWINKHFPNAELVSASSTAMAAELAHENPRSAAIGHAKLADIYGLKAMFKEIEDDKDNWTRFVAITNPDYPIHVKNDDPNDTSAWKSSFIFTVKDHPGSLVAILSILDSYKINMGKLESRPLRGNNTGSGNWEYAFFTDAQSDITLGKYASLLKELNEKCRSLRVLGSYPQGDSLN